MQIKKKYKKEENTPSLYLYRWKYTLYFVSMSSYCYHLYKIYVPFLAYVE